MHMNLAWHGSLLKLSLVPQRRACVAPCIHKQLPGLVKTCPVERAAGHSHTCNSMLRGLFGKRDGNEQDDSSSQKLAGIPSHWRETWSKTRNKLLERKLVRYWENVKKINALEPSMEALSNDELRAKTDEFKKRLQRGASLDSLLVEAFAVVREASKRVLGLRQYDVQLIGGMVLDDGNIAEMQTGEGKTLVAVAPAYLHALTGKGVHIVTVNDYLAQRDANGVGKVFCLLGLTVGVVQDQQNATFYLRRDQDIEAFAADITYVTANDLAVCYLRDQMEHSPQHLRMKRPLHYAIVDEADMVLIDDSINPIVISNQEVSTDVERMKQAHGVASVLFSLANSQGALLEGLKEYKWKNEPVLFHKLCWEFVDAIPPELRQPGHDGLRRKFGMLNVQLAKASRYPFASVQEQPSKGVAFCVRDEWLTFGASSDWERIQLQYYLELELVYNDYLSKNLTIKHTQQRVMELTDAGMKVACEIFVSKGLLPMSEAYECGKANTAALWRGDDCWGPYLLVAMHAIGAFVRDVDYVVVNGKVVIINTGTGRLMENSRWEIHQAIEVKENLDITLHKSISACISFQTLFRYYEKLCGMTGTASTEVGEFDSVYGLAVVEVPTHRPRRRVDHGLHVYLEKQRMHEEIYSWVSESVHWGQPVLIGTTSVQQSDELYRLLREKCISEGSGGAIMSILNARPENVAAESTRIALAGLPNCVTIATNMAGRGTDILLGGNPKYLTRIALYQWLLCRLEGSPGLKDSDIHNLIPLAYSHHFGDNVLHLVQNDGGPVHRRLNDIISRLQSYLGNGGVELDREAALKVLTSVLERAEECRADMRLSHSVEVGSNAVAAIEACEEFLSSYTWDNVRAREGTLPQELQNDMSAWACLMWIYFEWQCARKAQQVRIAGGLLVISASQQKFRRIEEQLIGRAGRQGDPGETVLLCKYSDSDELRKCFGDLTYDVLARDWVTNSAIAQFFPREEQRREEAFYRSSRNKVIMFDEKLEVYRNHVYTLRRLILCGTPEQREQLIYSYIQEVAAVIVDEHVDAHQPPEKWAWEDMMVTLQRLVNPEDDTRPTSDDQQSHQPPDEGPPITDSANQTHQPTWFGASIWIPMTWDDTAEYKAALRMDWDLPFPKDASLWTIRSKAVVNELLRSEQPRIPGLYGAKAELLRDHFTVLLISAYHAKQVAFMRKNLRLSAWIEMEPNAERYLQDTTRTLLLATLDDYWAGFLKETRDLQEGVTVRLFSHLDPLQEFVIETMTLFDRMLDGYKQETVQALFAGAPLFAGPSLGWDTPSPSSEESTSSQDDQVSADSSGTVDVEVTTLSPTDRQRTATTSSVDVEATTLFPADRQLTSASSTASHSPADDNGGASTSGGHGTLVGTEHMAGNGASYRTAFGMHPDPQSMASSSSVSSSADSLTTEPLPSSSSAKAARSQSLRPSNGTGASDVNGGAPGMGVGGVGWHEGKEEEGHVAEGAKGSVPKAEGLHTVEGLLSHAKKAGGMAARIPDVNQGRG